MVHIVLLRRLQESLIRILRKSLCFPLELYGEWRIVVKGEAARKDLSCSFYFLRTGGDFHVFD